MVNEFHPATYRYMEDTDIDIRKSKGQYFTPRYIREQLLNKLPKDITSPKILDPSCGTGEFLLSAKKIFADAELFGWDIDPELVNIGTTLVPDADYSVLDTLEYSGEAGFDLVIGNPPYFEFSPAPHIKSKFKAILGGRPNIFSFFIKAGLDALKDGGYLAYVLPPSMNNGAYFTNLRQYIVNSANIESLEILNGAARFHNAFQSTMLLVLRKSKNNGAHIFEHNGIRLFTEDPGYLREAFKGKTCLYDLGFRVKTGRLVWNANKELLTDDPEKGVPLIWSHNITDEGLKHPVPDRKPQYVEVADHDTGPAIVVNRVTGATGATKLRAAVIPPGQAFIAENHCNVIFPGSDPPPFEELLDQLRSPEKIKVMKKITGNTQISKTELEKLFPIDISCDIQA